mmetsp:Transcript_122071/g.211054  ORF Transcript_122071/g.211054 Transcript_122071/m.211054 type:complete len:84 (-) Transcript_122071:12-263(-)
MLGLLLDTRECPPSATRESDALRLMPAPARVALLEEAARPDALPVALPVFDAEGGPDIMRAELPPSPDIQGLGVSRSQHVQAM